MVAYPQPSGVVMLLICSVGGIVFGGGFNTGMEKATTEEFALAATKQQHGIRNTWILRTQQPQRASVRPA